MTPFPAPQVHSTTPNAHISRFQQLPGIPSILKWQASLDHPLNDTSYFLFRKFSIITLAGAVTSSPPPLSTPLIYIIFFIVLCSFFIVVVTKCHKPGSRHGKERLDHSAAAQCVFMDYDHSASWVAFLCEGFRGESTVLLSPVWADIHPQSLLHGPFPSSSKPAVLQLSDLSSVFIAPSVARKGFHLFKAHIRTMRLGQERLPILRSSAMMTEEKSTVARRVTHSQILGIRTWVSLGAIIQPTTNT